MDADLSIFDHMTGGVLVQRDILDIDKLNISHQ